MGRHTLTHAEELFAGGAQHNGAFGAKRGIPLTTIYQADLGVPITLDADGLIKAATGAELPNAATKTYAFPGSGSPQDGVNTSGVLDVPRNITVAATHASAVVAMDVMVAGVDQYGEAMSEVFAITATGTSKAVAGKKAFAKVASVSIIAATDATGNTLNIGWGDALGLPFRVGAKRDVLASYRDDTMELATATVVVGDATAATAATGDVRGTYTPASATDGSKHFSVWMKPFGIGSREQAYGVDQA